MAAISHIFGGFSLKKARPIVALCSAHQQRFLGGSSRACCRTAIVSTAAACCSTLCYCCSWCRNWRPRQLLPALLFHHRRHVVCCWTVMAKPTPSGGGWKARTFRPTMSLAAAACRLCLSTTAIRASARDPATATRAAWSGRTGRLLLADTCAATRTAGRRALRALLRTTAPRRRACPASKTRPPGRDRHRRRHRCPLGRHQPRHPRPAET